MFSPPDGQPAERILCYGGSNTGKTYSLLKVAKRCQRSGSPAHFYVLDTDNAWARMLAGPEFKGLTNVTVRPARKWAEYKEATADYLNKVTPHDWLGIDFYGTGWQAVQSAYIQNVMEQTPDEFWADRAREKFENKRKGDMKRGGFEGRDQWQYINKWFFEWRDDVLWAPCHVYATCVADNIQDTDAKSLREYCRDVGMKPKGQKETVHVFHTVLCFERSGGERTFTSVRDRERKEVEGRKLGDFSLSYLENIAMWGDPDEDDDDD